MHYTTCMCNTIHSIHTTQETLNNIRRGYDAPNITHYTLYNIGRGCDALYNVYNTLNTSQYTLALSLWIVEWTRQGVYDALSALAVNGQGSPSSGTSLHSALTLLLSSSLTHKGFGEVKVTKRKGVLKKGSLLKKVNLQKNQIYSKTILNSFCSNTFSNQWNLHYCFSTRTSSSLGHKWISSPIRSKVSLF